MSVRDFFEYGSIKMPFPADAFVESLYDLTYPIYQDGVKTDNPPTVLFVFGILVRPLKIAEIKTVRIQWDPVLLLKKAEITLTTIEDIEETKQRINSYKSIGNLF
jgi:hypothetical protein